MIKHKAEVILDLKIEPFIDDDVSITMKGDMISISGNIEYTDPSTNLEPYFNQIHNLVLKKKLKFQ